MSTVSTINGKPHAQLARQLAGLATMDVKTPCAIVIETIINRLPSRIVTQGGRNREYPLNNESADEFLDHRGTTSDRRRLPAYMQPSLWWSVSASIDSAFPLHPLIVRILLVDAEVLTYTVDRGGCGVVGPVR
jgi:hypothetical protein